MFFLHQRRQFSLNIYHNILYFCLQEATAEEVEFDDEEVVEEVDDNKDY